VLLVGNALREILTLLASAHVSPWFMVRAILYLIPFVWVFALPMGMLTATLLVFGRISADQELTAARASGVSLMSLVMPVLLLSLLCCTLSAWFNMDLGPRCRVAYKGLILELQGQIMNAQLPEGRFIRDFPGYIFYVEKNDGGQLRNVMIYRLQNETNVDTTLRAVRGQLRPERAQNELVVDLFDARSVTIGEHGNAINSFPTLTLNLSLNTTNRKVPPPRISDMTFLELRQELRNLEHLAPPAPGTNTPVELRAQLKLMRQQQKDFIEPVRVFVRVFWFYAGRHPAGHPRASPRDEHRHRDGAGAGAGVLRLHHAGRVAVRAPGAVPAPDSVGAELHLPSRRRGAAVAGEQGNLK